MICVEVAKCGVQCFSFQDFQLIIPQPDFALTRLTADLPLTVCPHI
jgi:hypothetical protein